MDTREDRLIEALVFLAHQWLSEKDVEGRECLDSRALEAGERAILALSEYGLVELMPGPGRTGGYLTDAGKEVLRKAWGSNG
ncbi:hypothetical protein [Acidocella sp.]|uniref:hypothetical protein n=1 Tax=Acidocella sp. TaxID=50710 RepID=UPI003D01A2CE